MLAGLYERVVDQRTGSGWRIPALDGLRGVAALMVLVAHTRQACGFDGSLLWAPIERGGLGGVILFFALSGFLLYLPWLRSVLEHRPPPRFKSYAIRRCLRIMPAYYASVIVLAVLRVALGRGSIGFLALAMHFLFLPTLLTPLQIPYWTLQVEELFYWILPAVHHVVVALGAVRLVALASAVSLLWGLVGFVTLSHAHYSIWLEQTPFFLPAFALGISTAVRWQAPGFEGRALFWLGVLVYVASAPVASYLTRECHWRTPTTEVLMAPAASAIVLGAARGGARFLERPTMRFLGAISFSIYLWHAVVIHLVPVPRAFETFGPRVGYTVALTIPLALASYLVIERPFLMLRPRPA
jgi:peptidoglycan/LPS O-acetylase OafA/YrhL